MKKILLFTALLASLINLNAMHYARSLGAALVRHDAALVTAAVAATAWHTAKDDIRCAALANETLKQHYPALYQTLVVRPLFNHIHYGSLREYTQESNRSTIKRQVIACKLVDQNIPLELSQTEADLLTYMNPRYKKKCLDHEHEKITYNWARHDGEFIGSLVRQYFTGHPMLEAMYAQEKKYNAQKIQVQYHSMPVTTYVTNYIGTRLKASHAPTNFLLLRQLVPVRPLKDRIKDYIWYGLTQNNTRQKLLSRKSFDALHEKTNDIDGHIIDTSFDTRIDGFRNGLAHYLVSCCPFITGGFDNYNECMLYYFRCAQTGGLFETNNFTLEKLFTSLNIPTQHQERYIPELNAALERFGYSRSIILQIATPTELTQQCVYPAHAYGLKRNVYRDSHSTDKIATTTEVFEQLRNNPFKMHIWYRDKENYQLDGLQTRVIVDKTLLLDAINPEVVNGLKVHVYAGRQESLDQLHKDIDDILIRMMAEIGIQQITE